MSKSMQVGLMGFSTEGTINWGSQATSDGLRYMLAKSYPEAAFLQVRLPQLPFKKIKLLRRYYETKLVKAVLSDDLKQVRYYLKKLNMHEHIFEGCTHICFNGEGMIHHQSGHISVLMGLLYREKKSGKYVAVVNQTVDLGRNEKLESVVAKVYNTLDFISVREPLSYAYVKKIGITHAVLVPDAVYGLPKMGKEEIIQRTASYRLPEKYMTLTGSSALKRDRRSLEEMKKIIAAFKSYLHLPIVFMANAKTDIWLARQLQKTYDMTIIEPPVKYQDAIAIIANSELLAGGRQHPNIFAYIYHVPYLPFRGNTFKNEGVAKLQRYPLLPLPWNTEKEKLLSGMKAVQTQKIDFLDITIDTFDILGIKDIKQ
jgi:polysaccharide pyruvyl transferase WcaK-like protein